VATVALGLLATGEALTPAEADEMAREVWRERGSCSRSIP
jgi:hypothetical protein